MIIDLIADMVSGCLSHGLVSFFKGKKKNEDFDSDEEVQEIEIDYDDYKFHSDNSESESENCSNDEDNDSDGNDLNVETYEKEGKIDSKSPYFIITYEREESEHKIPRLDDFTCMLTFECLTPPDRIFDLRREVTFRMNLGLPFNYFMDTKTVNYCIRNLPGEDMVFIIHTVSFIHYYCEEYDVMQIVAKFETMFRLVRHDASIICNLDIPFLDDNDEKAEYLITVREWETMDEFYPSQFIFSKEYHRKGELFHLDVHVYLG